MQQIAVLKPTRGNGGWIVWIQVDGHQAVAVLHSDAEIATTRASTVAGVLRDTLSLHPHLEF